MRLEPKPFQKAGIDAICRHFERHDRALCADEAGLGKTIVARGVIEALALERLGEAGDGRRRLGAWWAAFCEQNVHRAGSARLGVSQGGETGQRNRALRDFLRAIAGDPAWEYRPEGGETLYNAVRRLGEEAIGRLGGREELRDFLLAAARLYLDSMTSQNGRKWFPDWEFSCGELLPQPYRVLYVCCNLAIAEQNVRKLVSVPQRSRRSASDCPDRLSTLWYYLENYPTPFLEIYPVTSTVSKRDTPGTRNEREKLAALYAPDMTREQFFGALERDEGFLREARGAGERRTLDVFRPDLIIFDEFQNFTDMVRLIDLDDAGFAAYCAKLSGRGPEGEEDGPREDRAESLARCRRIVQGLARKKGDRAPKLLFLSATPFHRPGGPEGGGADGPLTSLSMPELAGFMGGTSARERYERAVRAGERAEVEACLYEDCGIFRSERARLMQKSSASYHLLRCGTRGLFARAMAIGSGEGNRAAGIVRTAPEFLRAAGEAYGEGKYRLRAPEAPLPELPRFARLREVVSAPDANDVGEAGPLAEYAVEALGRLLWIPPVTPSAPLRGVFARYRGFSKTLVFSNLKITPLSIAGALNGEIPVRGMELDGDARSRVRAWLEEEVFAGYGERGALAGAVCRYLCRAGGYAIGERPGAGAVIDYCKAGCLADVVREYLALAGSAPEDLLHLFHEDSGRYFGRAAFCMDQAELNREGNCSIRRSFNAPFYPFILATTSIGAEGLDFHRYCSRVAHYTRPSGVIDLEQKNGRIDRYASLAQRRWWNSPGSRFLADTGRLRQMREASGGMVPDWDAGEGGLHYYFFYTLFTSEREELLELFRRQDSYRARLGRSHAAGVEGLDLSPFSRSRRG